MAPTYDVKLVVNSAAISTSGTNTAYSSLLDLGKVGMPEIDNYVNLETSRYQELQQTQDRAGAVRAFVTKLSLGPSNDLIGPKPDLTRRS